MSRFGQRTRISTAISGWMPTGDEVPQNTPTIELLLVGGGGTSGAGNGSQSGGGGGGGGVYSSVASNPGSGPGGSVQPVTSIASGVTYTITVGGAATDSTFAAPTIPTITATKGANGLSGGGTTGGAGGTATGQPLSYAGGNVGPGNMGGGGAGASAVGLSGQTDNTGRGGAGISNTIRAAQPAPSNFSTQIYGSGQPGGKVVGAYEDAPGQPGYFGSGGYGGQSSGPGLPANSGNPGVCVLRYPDTYPVATSTSGSPTQETTGGYHIYAFTASGSIVF